MVNKEKDNKNIAKVKGEQKAVQSRAKRPEKKAKKKQADDKSARIKKAREIKKFFSWTILIGIIVGIIVFLCQSIKFLKK